MFFKNIRFEKNSPHKNGIIVKNLKSGLLIVRAIFFIQTRGHCPLAIDR